MSAIFLNKKICSRTHSDTKFGRRGVRQVILMPGKKKGSRYCSHLHPSEKELLEQCSGTFHHANTPAYNQVIFPAAIKPPLYKLIRVADSQVPLSFLLAQ
jgi:hypothetical protein